MAVLLVDILKGIAAILFARSLLARPHDAAPRTLEPHAWRPWAVALTGLAALLGHSRSIWLRFSGGKSVATGLGVALAMSWPVALGALTVFGVVVAILRIVSLGSILSALMAIVLIFATEQPLPYRLLIIAGGLYVVARHHANIRRLLAGAEPRIGQSLGS